MSLKSLGIKVTGRSVKRRKNYRSTQEILRWSTALLLGRPVAQLEDENRNDTLLGYRSALRGQGPTVHAATTEEAELDALVSRVRAWLDAGVGAGGIGVSARFNKTCAKAVSRLTAAGIPAAPLRSADAAGDTAAVRVRHDALVQGSSCVAVVGVNDGALPFPKAVTPAELDQQAVRDRHDDRTLSALRRVHQGTRQPVCLVCGQAEPVPGGGGCVTSALRARQHPVLVKATWRDRQVSDGSDPGSSPGCAGPRHAIRPCGPRDGKGKGV
ncbi:hypothetical protein GCM10018787_24720 [Streptomyces thermodiastaticus]|nr:hypothetical protein [Streptomyces thermodiastaticus]MCE7548890.1 hypothetical protein [Streptomyces thermodiastaticus]GHF75141.1 hypothetical protein GCM10018787_24720 [Streptomyces thermodiastaticus]